MKILVVIAITTVIIHAEMVELTTDYVLLTVYFLLPEDVVSVEGLR